ncbi:GNAT family N-acetyltransferase [Streptomyces sp. WAC05374]|uniref:GNAT family N-acetyltransferase n=1 Tax=Streptomyces sp. WAC05374 TaxID=2487420 RepID=UPI000F89A0CC|nr:GNAT family N-acetyltransferase [Streptomyces sp. WAC05374]RST17792.1 GNAT family N-acetyltransferase [Streptomyces sp. WAC05374]TDF46121.1 GNAT family N-acetyltransferase [Streptomyces sp. WAC05374]TDF52367.1 GNAT family N-acetyltransferase [Streptomyces sp. WAC05374]TDF58328.1 GNAT family N-acetyltransferase [Streptomyces sp. WAC05374]
MSDDLRTEYRIEPLTAQQVHDRAAEGLALLLRDAVDGGASVGFLAPLGHAEAAAWWRGVARQATEGVRSVWAAYGPGGALSGVITLVRASMPNQPHRGDIAKLLVHRDARGRGLGSRLLAAAEAGAREEGLTLLVLDTETGSAAEGLYRKAGWTRAGTIPDYALDPSGTPHPTTYYYKRLTRG